ncbi:TetR/AcrR family transcriptional regulator [Paraburkholderia sp. BL6665CI2N2]|uniref:TetR/AcrR family transcriptional regulator n=1 Tax=Paraburkholderia sp. BL6665CI2N2 TaxID=1938806 RepID=UPI0014170FF4|nr:TetR/AcrR family transcriptional regulator [Paraburkholderia sp. BL6665CI2N2]
MGSTDVRDEARADETTAASDTALTELASWLDQGLLPELVPTRQRRSLRTALAMLDAGRTLLEDRSLEELSIEAVCQAAGTTVGAFYGRFENKLAFFVTMQRLQTIRTQIFIGEVIQKYGDGRAGIAELCEQMVLITVRTFRSNRGVLRASLQHTEESMWDLFKESGDRFRVVMEKQLTPHLTHLPATARRLRILFAFQSVAGVLVHATLNDPGPLSLDDSRLVPELIRLVQSYLLAPADTAATRTRKGAKS